MMLLFSPWSDKTEGIFTCEEANPIRVFLLDKNIVTAALGESLECCFHGCIGIEHMAPDLVSINY